MIPKHSLPAPSGPVPSPQNRISKASAHRPWETPATAGKLRNAQLRIHRVDSLLLPGGKGRAPRKKILLDRSRSYVHFLYRCKISFSPPARAQRPMDAWARR